MSQIDFLNQLGVKTPGEVRKERAEQRRAADTLRKSRNAHTRAMQAKARASESATCCINFYSRRIHTAGWTRCQSCGKPLVYQ